MDLLHRVHGDDGDDRSPIRARFGNGPLDRVQVDEGPNGVMNHYQIGVAAD